MAIEFPRLQIDLVQLEHNARTVVNCCAQFGIAVAGVVKCCCGAPEVARCFAAGGVAQLADARVANLRRLREAGIMLPLWLLRLPMPSEVAAVVRYADLSLNSSLEVLQLLSDEAVRQRKIHQVILMVDLGDRREGVLPGEVVPLVAAIRRLPGIYLAGLGTNLTCYGGIVPDEHNMQVLAETVRQVRRDFGLPLPYVSAGNSSSVTWALAGKMPPEVNHLRLGEALLLGHETANGQALPGTSPRAFTLQAEVIELALKPSRPEGEAHLDAFGQVPHWEDRGIRHRAILGIGREDVRPEGLTPQLPGVEVLGASSDHLICDVENSPTPIAVGQIMDFALDYGALLGAMTSPYVLKNYVPKLATGGTPKTWAWIGYEQIFDAANAQAQGSAAALLKLASGISGQPVGTAHSVVELQQLWATQSAAGRVPVVVGGDSTGILALGAASGCGVLVFSAFGDFNDASSGGTRSGRALAALCGRDCGAELKVPAPCPERHIVHIGLRATDRAERRKLREADLKLYTMEQLDLLGMREVIGRSLKYLADTPQLVVVISLSVLDPGEFAGATQSVPAGISLRELYCALEILADTRQLAGVVLGDCCNTPEAVAGAGELLATLGGKKIV